LGKIEGINFGEIILENRKAKNQNRCRELYIRVVADVFQWHVQFFNQAIQAAALDAEERGGNPCLGANFKVSFPK
jgi:hypothetical protein